MRGIMDGIHEYAQSGSLSLPGQKSANATRGEKSLAAFIEYPVSPPKDIPMETIIAYTNK